jgi:hypothetical protein
VKLTRYKHTSLVSQAYFVWYEKSPIDQQTIIARGFLAVRDFRFDYRNVETQLQLETFYVFQWGHPGSMFWDSCCFYPRWRDPSWDADDYRRPREMSTVWSRLDHYFPKNRICNADCSLQNVAAALSGTPLQYIPLEPYQGESMDMVKLLDLACQYPCVEYLTKMGLGELVNERLRTGSTRDAVNWRGKSVTSVLRCRKQDVQHIINQIQRGRWTAIHLWLYQQGLKFGFSLTDEEIQAACRIFPHDRKQMQKTIRQGRFDKVIRYIIKQQSFITGPLEGVLRNWNDYLDECAKLEMDCTSDSILFPSNLLKAHQETTKRVKYKEDAALNEKITVRATQLLKKYRYSSGGLMIRPAISSGELVAEGNALHHCVGGYAKRYAEGQTIILVVRKKSHPDTPFFTVEMDKDKVVQCRGDKNCPKTQEVGSFLDGFIATLNHKKAQGKQARIRVPA